MFERRQGSDKERFVAVPRVTKRGLGSVPAHQSPFHCLKFFELVSASSPSVLDTIKCLQLSSCKERSCPTPLVSWMWLP